MMLPINCIPCPAPVRHVVRHVARHVAHHVHHRVFRPIGRRVHHVAHSVVHHAPRVITYGCCATAVGGLGGALVAPPGGYFVPPAIAEASPANTTQGWPEMPAYSGMGGGVAIGGGGAMMIPVYQRAPTPQLLDTRPVGFPPKPQNVPEPSSVALFLLPGLWVLWVRRRMRT